MPPTGCPGITQLQDAAFRGGRRLIPLSRGPIATVVADFQVVVSTDTRHQLMATAQLEALRALLLTAASAS